MKRLTPDQARAILDRDPLKYVIPSPTQAQFLARDIADHYALIESVSRGGKSAVSCIDLAWMLRGIHPYRPNHRPLTLLQLTPSRLQAANVIGAKLFKRSELILPGAPAGVANEPMIPQWEIAKLNEPNVAGMKVPYEVVMRNGNRCLFSWSGVDGIQKRLAGLRLDGAYVDEDAGTQALFDELYLRLLDAQSDKSRPGLGYFVWSNTNLNYNDAFQSFRERVARQVPGHRIFVIGKFENVAIDAGKREAMRDVLSADAAATRLDGDETAGDRVSIFHKQWGDARHILPTEYQPNKDDNLWVGYDPGVDHPMGMLIVAINKDQPMRLTAVKCWNSRGETIEHDADNLKNWLRGRRLAGFVYDTNLKNKDRGGGPSVLTRFKELMAARGIAPLAGWYQSKKNHAPGIALLRHYLDPNADDRTVPPLLVLAKPTDENGVGMLRRQILAYRGNEATKFTGPGGVVKKDDELMDAIRYVCMQRPAHNPDWSCGRAIDIASERVDFTETTQPKPEPSTGPRNYHTIMRSRDRRILRGRWREVAI